MLACVVFNFSGCRSNGNSTIEVLACVVFNFSACRSNGNFQMCRASVAVQFLILVHVGAIVILECIVPA